MPPRTTTALRDPRELMAAVFLARNVYYNISRCGRAEFRVNSRDELVFGYGRKRPLLIACLETEFIMPASSTMELNFDYAEYFIKRPNTRFVYLLRIN